MAISGVPFALQNQPHNADLFREAVSSLVPNGGGVIQSGDLAVTQTGVASMAVVVGVGRAWIPGTNLPNLTGQGYSKQGMYYVMNDASVTVPIDTADTANPRIDLIYAQTPDTAYSMASDVPVISVVKGQPALSPSVPATPTNGIALAQVAVAANATSIVAANITTSSTLAIAGSKAINGGNPTNITAFTSPWVAAYATGNRRPRVWSADGITAHITGLVQFNGGTGTIATIPSAYAPTDGTVLTHVGACNTSNGPSSTSGGPVLDLGILGGALQVVYQTGPIPTGSFVPLHGSWLIKG